MLILPNLMPVDEVLRDALADITPGGSEEQVRVRMREVDAVVDVVIKGLDMVAAESGGIVANFGDGIEVSEDDRRAVVVVVGEVVGERVCSMSRRSLVTAILATADVEPA